MHHQYNDNVVHKCSSTSQKLWLSFTFLIIGYHSHSVLLIPCRLSVIITSCLYCYFSHFLFFSAFQSLPVPNTTLSLYFVNSLLFYFPIFSVFLSFLFLLFLLIPSSFCLISRPFFLSSFALLVSFSIPCSVTLSLLFHGRPCSCFQSVFISYLVCHSVLFYLLTGIRSRMLCGVTRIVACPAEPPSQVPPLTPGTNKKIADALMASFENWNKEQEKRNIPKGEKALE